MKNQDLQAKLLESDNALSEANVFKDESCRLKTDANSCQQEIKDLEELNIAAQMILK